ncbi:MAG TPA: PEP-CTERM sorting domain-containing protein [Alicycliphilus sp.]|nr:PEP-CTERM sorting domain-containing protein [Alicycliphilus sp.]
MFKRTFLATAVGTALLLGAAVSANALTITSGNYKITLDNYDSGTTGYNTTTPGVICSSVAACNAVPHTQAPGSTNDTSGIFSIASISNVSTGVTEYLRGVAGTVGNVAVGPYLTGVFGGLQDASVNNLGGGVQRINSQGGFFNIYNNAADYTPALGPAGGNLNAGTYTGITTGTLFLSGVFAAGGAVAGDLNASYTSLFDTTATSGSGQGYLDFTGGAAWNFFNTNSVTNKNNGQNDAFITITYDDVNQEASKIGWTVKSVAQVSGQVPEPGTMALLSLAVLGMGAVARRRNKQG